MPAAGGTGIGATVLGYPRIGPRRELKKALEAHWAGRSGVEELERVAAELRAATRTELAALDSQPTGTFSYYDQVADVTALVDAVPARFRPSGRREGTALEEYFALARGTKDAPPMEMTKWFDTNYHYLVPEIGPDTAFRLAPEGEDGPVRDFREAVDAGVRGARPALVGPVSYLLLAKPSDDAPHDFTPVSRADDLVEVYAELLGRLADAGAEWVQLEESAFVHDRSEAELAALRDAYAHLAVVGPDGSLAHVHPVRVAPGRYAVRLTPGSGGRHGVFAEVQRAGGGGHQIARTAVDVAGPPAPPVTAAPPGPRDLAGLQADVTLDRTATGRPGGVTVTFSASGRPVGDLQAWLGMAGHLLLLGPGNSGVPDPADPASTFGHVHDMTAAGPAGTYGPRVRFDYAFPREGRYALWVQVQRDHRVLTVPVTLDVGPDSAS